MRELTAEHPETIGGRRLLARLGAGGMGVVYLARGRGGQLEALKVIRAEHAADDRFRARFAREARLAARVRGRWVVRVTGSDTDAQAPWLATEFVPGPTLAEAVAGHGPLPLGSLLTLGQRTAEALADVHEAGLVHRDVKPGNIVLGQDGPHLIDFGIVRGGGATALTAPDAVLGTPGYLSPEQTRAYGDDVGPASDVFALGCVLVYAASARPPFGSGDPAAVLYRTVYEEPDTSGLDRMPAPARTAVVRCLAKDPEARPTAAELRDILDRARTRPDPRSALVEGTTSSGHEARTGPDSTAQGWLPLPVLRMVAAHATRALDPPLRTAAPATDTTAAEGTPAPSRRRILTIAGAAGATFAVGGAGALFLAARGGSDADPRRGPALHSIGLHAVGREQERGARLAVDAHNSRSDAPFRLALRTAHAGERAVSAARRLLADTSVCAVIGPTSATDVRAVMSLYGDAYTPMLLVSAPANAKDLSGNRALCVTRIGDDSLGLPLSVYLTQAHRSRRTAVIEDGAGGAPASELARMVRELPPGNGTTTRHTIAADATDFGPVVAEAVKTKPDAVVYAGTSPGRAASCARSLARADFEGARVSIEPVMRAEFLDAAAEAADGWVFAAPYSEPRSMTTQRARAFTTSYRGRFGAAPGRWSAEARDAVELVARTLDALGDGFDITPGQVADRLFRIPTDGVAKPLRFDSTGATHTLDPSNTAFLYGAADGRFRFLGRYDQVARPFERALPQG
ncbi:bifunctional serine/threonine-protein kinase/ABC transporter substrate-binding protein [Streptomyces rhizosphaericus]|uniref:ABC transporter substrate-binding protein n=1 Tax=Streptomyces rhizosphaericus TaxID=114699 RepID=A0A6G4AEJ9_9ACTN|nr:bifunctional serine/threonine-protein kinase/ABC transporter substrate-binding protein [Streptomyces rhizosphaericus]NEW71650.1 ABC transporter substrate-binding protein [Streptomyces rhizosphaericus]